MIVVGTRQFADAKALESLVTHAATQYDKIAYAEDFDGVEITDPEYDELYKALKIALPKSKAFEGTSPSRHKTDGDIVVHKPPMTSIEKADGTLEEKIERYKSWRADLCERLGVTDDKLKLVQSYKHDGNAVRVNYVDGILVSAGTRPRNGVDGTDITRHMPNIEGVPQNLPIPLTLSLNGEIECYLEDFIAVNEEQDKNGEEPYKNPRNYTAGVLGRNDASESVGCRLRMAFYSITGFDNWEDYYTTEIERAKWANGKEGLNLQKDGKGYFVHMKEHQFKHLAVMEEFAKTKGKLPYYVDGVVLKVNNLEDQDNLGHINDDPVKAPRYGLAWKFEEETAEATVSSVEWNATRTGRVVPTAIFDVPFILADTENRRATCNNYGWMEDRGLGPGALVLCKKGGKIIPNIVKVINRVSDIGAPTHCPACKSKLVIETSSGGNRDLKCKNQECGAKQIHSWLFFLSNVGAKGLGTASMQQILLTGKVKTLSDLYTLTIDDLIKAGFSERQALLALATIWVVKPDKDDDKLKKSLEKAKTTKRVVEAWKVFAGLGISGAGTTAGKALVAAYKDFDKIMNASEEELQGVSGIGKITAKAIAEFFQNGGKTKVADLLNFIELELPKSGKLDGINFVLTGGFDGGKESWEAKIQAIGGNVQGSVGSKTNYLVAGEKVGKGKTDKAAKLGVPVITVEELEKML